MNKTGDIAIVNDSLILEDQGGYFSTEPQDWMTPEILQLIREMAKSEEE